MRLLASIPLFLVALLLLLPAAAQADVINACVNKKGSMRLVSDPTECKNSETSLSWNQSGSGQYALAAGARAPTVSVSAVRRS